MYHVSFDGTITDRQQFAVIGGQAERIRTYLQDHYRADLTLSEALALSRQSLLAGYERPPAEESTLEVGLLERQRTGRKFYRMPQAEVVRELAAANHGA